jgi:hypothetical protein
MSSLDAGRDTRKGYGASKRRITNRLATERVSRDDRIVFKIRSFRCHGDVPIGLISEMVALSLNLMFVYFVSLGRRKNMNRPMQKCLLISGVMVVALLAVASQADARCRGGGRGGWGCGYGCGGCYSQSCSTCEMPCSSCSTCSTCSSCSGCSSSSSSQPSEYQTMPAAPQTPPAAPTPAPTAAPSRSSSTSLQNGSLTTAWTLR